MYSTIPRISWCSSVGSGELMASLYHRAHNAELAIEQCTSSTYWVTRQTMSVNGHEHDCKCSSSDRWIRSSWCGTTENNVSQNNRSHYSHTQFNNGTNIGTLLTNNLNVTYNTCLQVAIYLQSLRWIFDEIWWCWNCKLHIIDRLGWLIRWLTGENFIICQRMIHFWRECVPHVLNSWLTMSPLRCFIIVHNGLIQWRPYFEFPRNIKHNF